MREGYRLPENNYSQQAIDFMDKVLEISGLGDYTFLSDGKPVALLIIALVMLGHISSRSDTVGACRLLQSAVATQGLSLYCLSIC